MIIIRLSSFNKQYRTPRAQFQSPFQKFHLQVQGKIRHMFHEYSIAAHKSVSNMIYHNVVPNNLHESSTDLQEQWALSRATNPQGQTHMANVAEICEACIDFPFNIARD